MPGDGTIRHTPIEKLFQFRGLPKWALGILTFVPLSGKCKLSTAIADDHGLIRLIPTSERAPSELLYHQTYIQPAYVLK